LEFLLPFPFRSRADNHSHFLFGGKAFEQVLQTCPFTLILNAARNANVVHAWHQNERSPWEGNICSNTGALCANRLFYNLHQNFLPRFNDIFDVQWSGLELALLPMKRKIGAVDLDVSRIKESVAFQTNIDKSSLHPRQNVLYPAFINIADKTLAPSAFDINFARGTVLKQNHPGLIWVNINNDFLFHDIRS